MAPPFWGNDIIQDKLDYLDAMDELPFDSYFIGSSRVNHQIDCAIFDKITESHSFNLGCPALSGFETMRLAHLLVDQQYNEESKVKNIFIGMPLLDFNKGKNINTTRGSYFYDSAAFITSVKNLASKDITFKRKLEKISFQFSIALKNTFKLGSFADLVGSFFQGDTKQKFKRFERSRGYIPLVVGEENSSGLQRRTDFLKDTTILRVRLNEAKMYVAKRKNLDEKNEFLFKEITALINKAKNKGINVYVVLFPKSNGVIYKKAMNVFAELDPAHTINLAKPGKYKDFYFSKFSYDKAHLNKRGSEKMTRALADEFMLIQSGQ